MKINGRDPVQGVERALPAAPVEAATARPDRVTVDRGPSAQIVADASSRASGSRVVRLRELEAAIKSGGYRPDPSQVADEILDAADIDARLRAMLND